MFWWVTTAVPVRCCGCGAERILLASSQLCESCSGSGHLRAFDLDPAPVAELAVVER